MIGLAFLGARQANNHQDYLVCFQLFIHSARTTAEEPIQQPGTHPEPPWVLIQDFLGENMGVIKTIIFKQVLRGQG